jgi:hypothetical protein
LKKAPENLAPAQALIGDAADGEPLVIMDEGWAGAEESITDENLVAASELHRRVVALADQDAFQAPLVDELIAQGIELARLKYADHAEFMFKTAITVAMRVGAQDKVALAALTMIEEVDQLPVRTMCDAMEMALEMPESMGTEMLRRVSNATAKVMKRAAVKTGNQEAREVGHQLPLDLEYEMLLYERSIFRNALVVAKGSLVEAALFVGLKPAKLFRRLRVEHQVLLRQLKPPVRLPPEE